MLHFYLVTSHYFIWLLTALSPYKLLPHASLGIINDILVIWSNFNPRWPTHMWMFIYSGGFSHFRWFPRHTEGWTICRCCESGDRVHGVVIYGSCVRLRQWLCDYFLLQWPKITIHESRMYQRIGYSSTWLGEFAGFKNQHINNSLRAYYKKINPKLVNQNSF